jgi:hypothetical protein
MKSMLATRKPYTGGESANEWAEAQFLSYSKYEH